MATFTIHIFTIDGPHETAAVFCTPAAAAAAGRPAGRSDGHAANNYYARTNVAAPDRGGRERKTRSGRARAASGAESARARSHHLGRRVAGGAAVTVVAAETITQFLFSALSRSAGSRTVNSCTRLLSSRAGSVYNKCFENLSKYNFFFFFLYVTSNVFRPLLSF